MVRCKVVGVEARERTLNSVTYSEKKNRSGHFTSAAQSRNGVIDMERDASGLEVERAAIAT